MTYDDMNLCASWYPVFIVVDDGFLSSHASALALTFVVFGTSAVADPRGGVGRALAGCADNEPEPEEAPLFFFFLGRFFNFCLGVVTARKKTNKQIMNLSVFFFLLSSLLFANARRRVVVVAPSAELDSECERAFSGPPGRAEEIEEEEAVVVVGEVVGEDGDEMEEETLDEEDKDEGEGEGVLEELRIAWSPAALFAAFFDLFLPFLLVVVRPVAVLLSHMSAAAVTEVPLNESAAIPSTITSDSDDRDVRVSRSNPPEIPPLAPLAVLLLLPLPPPPAAPAPAGGGAGGVGVVGSVIRGTST